MILMARLDCLYTAMCSVIQQKSKNILRAGLLKLNLSISSSHFMKFDSISYFVWNKMCTIFIHIFKKRSAIDTLFI